MYKKDRVKNVISPLIKNLPLRRLPAAKSYQDNILKRRFSITDELKITNEYVKAFFFNN